MLILFQATNYEHQQILSSAHLFCYKALLSMLSRPNTCSTFMTVRCDFFNFISLPHFLFVVIFFLPSNICTGAHQLSTVLDKSMAHLDTTSQSLISSPAPFEVSKFVEKLLSKIRDDKFSNPRELLTPLIEANVPPILIGDSVKMSQILGYFIENSVKFTGTDGKIGVRVELLSEQESPNHVELESKGTGSSDAEIVVGFSIFDNGVGMSNDTKKLLFKPLIQGDRYAIFIYFSLFCAFRIPNSKLSTNTGC